MLQQFFPTENLYRCAQNANTIIHVMESVHITSFLKKKHYFLVNDKMVKNRVFVTRNVLFNVTPVLRCTGWSKSSTLAKTINYEIRLKPWFFSSIHGKRDID